MKNKEFEISRVSSLIQKEYTMFIYLSIYLSIFPSIIYNKIVTHANATKLHESVTIVQFGIIFVFVFVFDIWKFL